MDDSVWDALPARDKVILWGQVDWIELERIHDFVVQENPTAPLSVVQDKTLEVIRSVVSDGLCLIGSVAGRVNRFTAWDMPLADSLQRIRSEYVDRFEDTRRWPWFCWLELTEEGNRVAEALRAKLEPA